MKIVAPVVHSVSAIDPSQLQVWQNRGINYDYAIGGQPFVSKASPQYPLVRKTADYTKTQIDQSREPGEQTLVTWWLRSQSSFHGGAGIVFEEPDVDDPTIQYRFQDSAGVDVWTPGHVSLLKKTIPMQAGFGELLGATDKNGVDRLWQIWTSTNALNRYTVINDTVSIEIVGAVADFMQSITQDGTNYYIATHTNIREGDLSSLAAPTVLWDLSAAPNTPSLGYPRAKVGWVKGRLMLGAGASVYELAGGAPPTLPAPVFTHNNPEWHWTGIAESPQVIYMSGYAGNSSAIYLFALDTTGLVPTLTGGILAAEMPEGEIVTSIYGYLGSFLAIGTNKGVRIAEVQSDGTLQYGPLSVTLPEGSTPVQAIVGRGRFLYGTYSNAIGGNSGLWRIDLGTLVGFRQYAYASDLQLRDFGGSHINGDVTSVTLYGKSDRLAILGGNMACIESASELEETGYLKTGNIRYHMLEPKLFKYLHLWAEPLTAGSVSVMANDHAGNSQAILAFTAGLTTPDPLPEVAFPVPTSAQQFISLTIGLQRDATDVTSGPTVTAYQLKALPAQKRQRTFVLPLACFDYESDSKDINYGYPGRALKRLKFLEALEEAGDIVQFDDLTVGGGPSRQVLIDGLQFIQDTSPSTDFRGSGWGGMLLVTLRAVD